MLICIARGEIGLSLPRDGCSGRSRAILKMLRIGDGRIVAALQILPRL